MLALLMAYENTLVASVHNCRPLGAAPVTSATQHIPLNLVMEEMQVMWELSGCNDREVVGYISCNNIYMKGKYF